MGAATKFDEQFVPQAASEPLIAFVRGQGEDRESNLAQDGRMDPSVSASWNRLDEPRLLRVVTERRTQALDRSIQTVLEVDKGPVGPKLANEFFALDDLARMFEQYSENLQGLPVERHTRVPPSQFPRGEVEQNRLALNRRPLCN